MKFVVTAVTVLVIAGCASQPVIDAVPSTAGDGATTTTAPIREDPAGELIAARQRWAAVGADDYSFRLLDDCGECDQLPERSLVVWDGDVIDPLRRAVSIEQAFEMIEKALASGRTVEVSYHPDLGYPMDLWIDPEARSFDGGTHLVFDSVEPGLPGSSASLEAHRAARSLWQSNGPGAYEYTSAVVCDCEYQVEMRTRVVDGLVTEFETQTPHPTDITFSPLTIAQMFDDVEAVLTGETLDAGYRVVGSALYDDGYGHPVWIGLDLQLVDPEAASDQPPLPGRLVLMVTHFEALQLSHSGDLAAARSRWEGASLDSYIFDVVFHDIREADFTDEFTVEVVAGRVVSVTQNGYDFGPDAVEGVGTIDELFDQIEATLRAGRAVEVIYDREFGYPSVMVFTDGGDGVSVTLRR